MAAPQRLEKMHVAPMGERAPVPDPWDAEPEGYTLLDLVRAIADVTDDEGEIVATVLYLLRSRRVRLIGSFRGETL